MMCYEDRKAQFRSVWFRMWRPDSVEILNWTAAVPEIFRDDAAAAANFLA